MNWKKVMSVVLALSVIGSVLAGCGSKAAEEPAETTESTEAGETEAEDEEEAAAQEGDTKTITDVRGEVEIPVDPQRIVDISGTSDILYILGYEVIGTANSDAYDYTKLPSYLEEELAGAEILGYFYQDTMDVEAILNLEPDLIIMSTVQEKMYDQLSVAAPTVMIELAQIDWTEDLMNVAGVMDREEEAQAWLDAYYVKAEEVGTEIREIMGEDATYGSFLASGGQLFVFSETGIGSIMYDDLGLKRPAGMPEQENVSLPVITYEGLAEIEADYMLAVGTDDDLADLTANSIWTSLPVVEAENYVELPANVYFGIGFSAVGRLGFLDEVVELLSAMQE